MSPALLLVFRALHIVTGAFWVGALFLVLLVLMPAIRGAGPAGAPVMEQLTEVRKIHLYMMWLPILTVLSGLGLMWNDSAGFSGPWMHSGPGRVFSLGAAFAILTMGVGMSVNSPTGRKLGALSKEMRTQGGPPKPEQLGEVKRLQGRMEGALRISAVFLLAAVVAMSVARYVPS